MKGKSNTSHIIGSIVIVIIAIICIAGFGILIDKSQQATYDSGFDNGKAEGRAGAFNSSCTIWDWADGYESGIREGRREGYRDAAKDTLKLLECYKTEEPTIENCIQVFLLEDYGILPHVNSNSN